jgi:hypothetical protein
MRRRDFVRGVAGSATIWPVAAYSQQLPIVGRGQYREAAGAAAPLKSFLALVLQNINSSATPP